MATMTYEKRRGEIETYFDRTAAETWAKLTSTAPVSGIRATVRKGRDEMRATLLSWLPDDLSGRRVLDAGCGTGAFAVEAARRGAHVVAIDVAGTLVDLARERAPHDFAVGSIEFCVGDMADPALGTFDHVVAMDSIIHYQPADMLRVIAGIASRTMCSMQFTFAPASPMLSTMHVVGKLFPRSDRSPGIVPVSPQKVSRMIAADPTMAVFRAERTHRVATGFYTSQAVEFVRA